MGNLSGKNAFVTGASVGIGASIARALIEAGCNICMHYFNESEEQKEISSLAESRKVKSLWVRADLTSEKETIDCVRECVSFFGTIDILVNNAGNLVARKYLNEVDTVFFQKVLDINLKTMMLATREAVPFLNTTDGSSIVNIASLAGRAGGHPGSLVYSAAKGAVLTWTRSLARELASRNIRVNAVAPGFIEGTPFHQTFTTRESALKTIEGIPLGRSGRPEDVARAVVFLASEYDGFITGETIDINGGVYCA